MSVVIPLFVEQVLAGQPITVTDPSMTRFMMTLNDAVDAEDRGDYFRVPPDGRDLNYAKFVEQGEARLTQSSHREEYHSHNTTRLDVAGMKTLLLKLDFMQRIARGEHAVAEE